MAVSILIILLMLLLSAFFSGMEIAFTSKNRLRLEIDRKQSRMFDRIAEIFSRHPGQYITTILVGNNIALVIYSLCMSLLLRSVASLIGWESVVREGSVLVETVVSTLIIIFFAEFLPKSVFKQNPNFYYRALAPVIFGFYLLLYPLARFTTLLSQGILRLLGHKLQPRTEQEQFDRTDLMNLLDANNNEPQHEADNEMKLFQNALDFADLRVRDCMVPRVDVEAIDADATSIEQLTARFIETKYTRIFVWRKSIDNMIGYVNSKSLFNNPRSIDEVLMEVLCVPETMPLQTLLKRMTKRKTNVAVVIDEFGGPDREAALRQGVGALVPAGGEIPERAVRSGDRGEPRVRHAGRIHHLPSGGDSRGRRDGFDRRSADQNPPHDPLPHRVGTCKKGVIFRRYFRAFRNKFTIFDRLN